MLPPSTDGATQKTPGHPWPARAIPILDPSTTDRIPTDDQKKKKKKEEEEEEEECYRWACWACELVDGDSHRSPGARDCWEESYWRLSRGSRDPALAFCITITRLKCCECVGINDALINSSAAWATITTIQRFTVANFQVGLWNLMPDRT